MKLTHSKLWKYGIWFTWNLTFTWNLAYLYWYNKESLFIYFVFYYTLIFSISGDSLLCEDLLVLGKQVIPLLLLQSLLIYLLVIVVAKLCLSSILLFPVEGIYYLWTWITIFFKRKNLLLQFTLRIKFVFYALN